MNEKHFLDTSVLRPILTSPPKVKEYYDSVLKGEKYTCEYVRMEFLRGYIKSSINFYFLLAMPQYTSFSDVLNIWSNKFQIREHKNIEVMIANLFEFNECLNNRDKSLRVLADYIRRLIGKLHHSLKKIGNDSTYCTKGELKLEFNPVELDESLRSFVNILQDNKQYKNCKINEFIKQKHKDDIKRIIEIADKINELGNKKGFDKIVESLKSLSEKEITCAYCSKLGDAIIALLSDVNWSLEHTDYSFNYLCEILNKKHSIHPYDKIIMDSQNVM